jgi:hypothetical protein
VILEEDGNEVKVKGKKGLEIGKKWMGGEKRREKEKKEVWCVKL